MGVNSSQIATRTNLLNNLGYRVGSGTTQCVTGAFLDSLNPKPDITTDNYSSNKTYSNFTTAEILNTTIVEKKYTQITVTPVSSRFALNTEYAATNFENTNIWSFDVSKLGPNTDISMTAVYVTFSLTGPTLSIEASEHFYIEVDVSIYNNFNYIILSTEVDMDIPTDGTTTSATVKIIDDEIKNINFTSDYPNNTSYADFNGVLYPYSPNTAYINIMTRIYFYNAGGNKQYIDFPANLKIKFNNTPVITTRCKSKLIKFDTLNGCKAVLPFRFGLSSKVVALSVDNMYLYGHVPTSATDSTYTKITLASHTGLSNTSSGDYKKYLDYIVIDPSSNNYLNHEKFVNASSYASFKAGTTGANRRWRVYLASGSSTDFSNVSSTDISKVSDVSSAKSINVALVDSNNASLDLVNVIRDNWGVMLEVSN